MPVDDPNTHLELTMIHEVMVLDHSGPEFGAILYGSALKLWIMTAILTGILIPVHGGHFFASLVIALAGMAGIYLIIGTVESSMARLRLLRIPQLLAGAAGLASIALILALRG
jgi:formate hydrogenlyase subunit 4